LRRAQISTALGNLTNSLFVAGAGPVPANLFGLVTSSGIADQIEMLKITPATLGREEMAWLWTALKADYRPTFPFQVSVLLIQPQVPAASALPVLQRSIAAQANMLAPFGTLTQISPPNGQPVACLQDIVTVTGANLGGVNGVTGVTLSNPRLGIELNLTTLANVSGNSFQFTLPSAAAANLPAGVYLVSAQIGSENISTNSLPLAIAPQIVNWTSATLASGSNITVPVTCAPDLFVGQQASLLIGSQEALLVPPPPTTTTNSLQFEFATLQSTGGTSVPMRLRVDGVDSPIINMSTKPPSFSSGSAASPGPTVFFVTVT
jgi:hypothetical protein